MRRVTGIVLAALAAFLVAGPAGAADQTKPGAPGPDKSSSTTAAPPAKAKPGAAAALSDAPTQDQLIDALVPASGFSLKSRGLEQEASRDGAAPAASSASPKPKGSVVAGSSGSSTPHLLDVRFAVNSTALSDATKERIRQLVATLQADQAGHYRLRLEGHTDSRGQPDRNLILSQERANSVRDYMVAELGMDPRRLEVVGRGQDEPLDPEHPESGDNRRVRLVPLAE